jgi:hypothetical protein
VTPARKKIKKNQKKEKKKKKKEGELWGAITMVGASEEGVAVQGGRVHRSHVI